MTTVLLGTTSAGSISATTCFASSFEQWKNFCITVGPVLLGHHLGELGDVGDAEPSVSKRLRDLREPPDQPGRDLSVVGRTPGHADLPEQVIEEAGEPELPVDAEPVELGEGEEEIDEGAVLAAGEIGDAEGPFACVHGSTIAREFSTLAKRTRTAA